MIERGASSVVFPLAALLGHAFTLERETFLCGGGLLPGELQKAFLERSVALLMEKGGHNPKMGGIGGGMSNAVDGVREFGLRSGDKIGRVGWARVDQLLFADPGGVILIKPAKGGDVDVKAETVWSGL